MENFEHRSFDDIGAVSEIAKTSHEAHLDLRPQSFDDYPGQEEVCEKLKIYTQAAKMRGRMLDHCLFHGPPGLGKTTLAFIVANVMGCELKVTSGPVIERAADLMGILAGLEAGTILFVDEIHRLPANVEEILYSAMEDRRIDVLIGQGSTTRTVKFDLPAFTLIGATTRPGALSAPLRNRFGIDEHLEYYSASALQLIIERSAHLLGIAIDAPAALALAQRSRGTPRIANVLLRRVIDFAIVAEKERIDFALLDHALQRLGIDSEGLGKMDRDILSIMRDRYGNGPVGLESIAAALNEEKNTLEDVYESYLVYRGFILRTPRGRTISTVALKHLEKTEQIMPSKISF